MVKSVIKQRATGPNWKKVTRWNMKINGVRNALFNLVSNCSLE